MIKVLLNSVCLVVLCAGLAGPVMAADSSSDALPRPVGQTKEEAQKSGSSAGGVVRPAEEARPVGQTKEEALASQRNEVSGIVDQPIQQGSGELGGTVNSSSRAKADTIDARAKGNAAQRLQAFPEEEKRTYATAVSRLEQKTVKPEVSKAYQIDIQDAVMLHNLMNSLSKRKKEIKDFELAVKDKAVCKARLEDFEECNEKWFADYFANPKQVWNTLKTMTNGIIVDYDLNVENEAKEDIEADNFLAGLGNNPTADVMGNRLFYDGENLLKDLKKQAGVRETEQKEHYAVSASVKEVMREAPEIDITFAVLNLFYPDQDAKKWGAVRKAGGHSLPLWEDQKYLYDRQVWKPKYDGIVKTCEQQGCTWPQNWKREADVKAEVKYDYYFYDEVKTAHSNFVKKAQSLICVKHHKKNPCVLTDEQKRPPEVAPRPLPPVYEEILILKDDNNVVPVQDGGIYPQVPANLNASILPKISSMDLFNPLGQSEPNVVKMGIFTPGTLWQSYANDGFKHVKNNGEFDKYFSVSKKGVKTKKASEEIEGNRLSLYLLYTRELENAEETYTSLKNDAEELKASIKDAVDAINKNRAEKIVIKEDIDYLNKKDLDKLLDDLKKGKKKLVNKAKKGIAKAKKNAVELSEMGELIPVETAQSITTTDAEALAENNAKEVKASVKPTAVLNESALSGKRTQALMEYKEGDKAVKGTSLKSLEEEAKSQLSKKPKEAREERFLQIDLAYINALEADKDAEAVITEETALAFNSNDKNGKTGSLAQSRANQKLLDILAESTYKKKKKEIENKNYRADLKKSCAVKSSKKLLDISKIQIK